MVSEVTSMEIDKCTSNTNSVYELRRLWRWFDKLSEESESDDIPIKESDTMNSLIYVGFITLANSVQALSLSAELV